MIYQAAGRSGRAGRQDKPIFSTRLTTFSGNSNARLFFLQFTKQSQWDRPTEPATEAPTQVKSNSNQQKRQNPLCFFSKLCVEACKDDDFVKGARLPSLGETQGLAQACQLASGSHHKNQGRSCKMQNAKCKMQNAIYGKMPAGVRIPSQEPRS